MMCLKRKERLKAVLCLVMSFMICFVAVFCVAKRARECFSLSDTAAMCAAFTVMPDGDFQKKESKKEAKTKKLKNTPKEKETKKVKQESAKSDEATYNVSELDLSKGAIEYNGFYVNNSTSYDMDIKSLPVIDDDIRFIIQR